MLHLLKIKRKINTFTVKVMESEKGEGIIGYILFAAIVILAVTATSPNVQNIFSSAVNSFGTWLSTKLAALFA